MERNNKKIKIIAIVIVIAILMVIALRNTFRVVETEEDIKEADKDAKTVFAEDLMEDINEEEGTAIEGLSDSFIEGNLKFSLELFKEFLEDENPVYSPTPVYLALGLIMNGGDEEAKEEILSVLNEKDIREEDLNLYYKELVKELTEVKGDTDLKISNSIWYDEDFKVNPDFLQKNKNYYKSDAYKIDFKDKKSPEAINTWVSEATNGKIDKMVDEIDDQVIMYLFSSIYFNGKWETPFPKEKSFEGEFFLEDGAIEVEKMSNIFEVKTIRNEDELALVLPYNDDKYFFLAIMPKEEIDLREYIKEINLEDINTSIDDIEEERMNIIFPKFQVSFEDKLNESLKNLGIKRIFNPEVNSLGEMGESSGNLYLSEMIQKTYIKVDEEGTEAASVVEAQIEATSLTESIDFNRPFIYSIVDRDTGLPIFLGIMDDPSKE